MILVRRSLEIAFVVEVSARREFTYLACTAVVGDGGRGHVNGHSQWEAMHSLLLPACISEWRSGTIG